MKKVIKNISMLLSMGVLIASCKQDFLNTQPLDKVDASAVWTDAGLAEAFVTDLYNGLHDGLLNQESMDCISDNALYNFGKMDIMEANVSPSNLGWVNNTYEWGEMYLRIRAANIALQNLAGATFDKPTIERLQGETHFMRGYFYNQMLRYYGGIPLIKDPYTLTSADFTIPRSSYKDCVDFVVSELDSASLLLNGKSLAAGRATKEAAMALKARVLLYAASDLHDIPTVNIKAPDYLKSFKNPELLGYVAGTGGSRTERWQKAQAAALAVIQLNEFGYMLDLTAPVSKEQAITYYTNAYLSRNGGEREGIFMRAYLNAKDEWGAWYPRNNCTNGYHGWTSSEPTQNLVDDYEMMDGTKFDWDKPENKAAPYDNRDPRLYASIMYDGSPWKPRTPDGSGIDPYNEIQFGTYQVGTAGNTTTYFGLDTRNSSIENWNGTRTGYAIKKFMDPDPSIMDQVTRQQIPSPQIRFTEVVFNYIEASIALNQEDEARGWLNKIRFRAGMPAITETGDALVARYRNERNVEMLFEEQRFYDARRWMIAPTTLGQKVRIIKINGILKPGRTVKTYKYSKDDYTYEYNVQEIDPGVENRKWLDKLYFLPISRDEVNKNSQLVQNPGYE